jgi:PBP1b-binding outer membrane lipoprotein LpoB
MKQLGIIAILLSMITFLVAGCASSSDSNADQTPKSAVPGEKVEGEDRLAPGAGPNGPNASVRW